MCEVKSRSRRSRRSSMSVCRSIEKEKGVEEEEGVQDEGVQDEGVQDEGVQDEGVYTACSLCKI